MAPAVSIALQSTELLSNADHSLPLSIVRATAGWGHWFSLASLLPRVLAVLQDFFVAWSERPEVVLSSVVAVDDVVAVSCICYGSFQQVVMHQGRQMCAHIICEGIWGTTGMLWDAWVSDMSCGFTGVYIFLAVDRVGGCDWSGLNTLNKGCGPVFPCSWNQGTWIWLLILLQSPATVIQ